MILLAIIMHACLAAIFPIGRMAVLISGPFFFNTMRMFLAALFITVFHYCKGLKLSLVRIKPIIVPIMLFAMSSIYWTNVAELIGLEFVPAAKASFIYSLSPFATALFSYFWLSEHMNWRKILGMFIAFTGFAVLLTHNAPGEIATQCIGCISWGEMMLISAALSSAYSWTIMRKLVQNKSYEPTEILIFSMFIGSFLSIISSFAFDIWKPIPVINYVAFGWYVLLASLFSSVIGYVLYVFLLRIYTATFLSFVGFLEPFFAALLGWIFLGEVVTKYFFISSGIVFIGLYFFYIEELEQGYIKKSS